MQKTADLGAEIAPRGRRIGDCRIFAIANQKGGVGKTTTAINFGTSLASIGRRVLVIDIDPQGNASTGLGVDRTRGAPSTYDVLHGDVALPAATVMIRDIPNLSIIPSTLKLAEVDAELLGREGGRDRLKQALRDESGAGPASYDYVLIDCPPSLNILTVNALSAADAVIVPLQCEFFALEGLSQLVRTIRSLRKSLNPNLGIQGVILTMYEKRHSSHEDVAAEARDFLGDLVFRTIVPRNIRIAEAPSFGKPVTLYDPDSPGAAAYIELVTEFLEREEEAV